MRIILGSQSPRRKEILSFFDIPFEQIASQYDEDDHIFTGDPVDYVKTLSHGKALDLHGQYSEAAVLTADTIVYKNGKIYGKPRDRVEAMANLAELQGSWHSVYTGLSLFYEGNQYDVVEETRVLFNPLTHQEINLYLDQLQWADKAGGYAIQMGGGLIVKKIDGCYYNVMGMPLNALRSIFNNIGIDLWEHMAKK